MQTKKLPVALAGVGPRIGNGPIDQKVTGLIQFDSSRESNRFDAWVVGQVLSWGRDRGNLINVSLPLFLTPFPSLSINK